MILGFCVSGSTAAVHSGDMLQIPLEAIFLFNNFLMCII